MSASYLFWITIFGVVVYMMAVDKNVYEYINLFFMGVWIQIKKYYYMAILHPRNPITNWIMKRKMNRLAAELLAKIREENGNTDEQI